jgi:acyl-CoA reductase-like NAD-dependent aldehyde dehydrogenase
METLCVETQDAADTLHAGKELVNTPGMSRRLLNSAVARVTTTDLAILLGSDEAGLTVARASADQRRRCQLPLETKEAFVRFKDARDEPAPTGGLRGAPAGVQHAIIRLHVTESTR